MFNESRLLDCVAYGSEFGYSYNTEIDELSSGVERRNAQWDRPLGKYSVIFQNLKQSGIAAVVHAHHACKGRLIGFRLKDWSDFKAENETLGIGDGTQKQYQLIKTYTFGALQNTRKIVKPVIDKVKLFANGTEITPSAIDYTTGLVTVTAPSGETLTWSGEFDVPVRFEDDELSLSINNLSGDEFVLNTDVSMVELRL